MGVDTAVLKEHVGGGRSKSGNHATFRDYVSLTKVGITVSNLMATFAGLWVASRGHPGLSVFIYTMIGTGLVVASGATLNNYVDRDIDGRMERTRERAVVAGKVPAEHAFWFGLSLGVTGLLVLAFLVNVTAAGCAFVGWIVYAYVYTVWLKRTTTLNTVFGGIAGAAPPLIGWAAGSGGVLDLGAWALFFTFFLWQPPHFLPLAMKRVEDYRAAGIPMLPVVRGFAETKRQIVRYTAALLPVSLWLYVLHYENWLYLCVVLVLGAVFLWRAVEGLKTHDDIAWASKLFRFSLIYLTTLCVILVVGSIPL